MRKVRSDYGWTVQQVAEAYGVSRSSISRVETGLGKPRRELVQFYEDKFQAEGQLLRMLEEVERALGKPSASRAGRLWVSTTERVNLRTAAEVLAWLAGVIAFALICPLWLTVAVASMALGAGAIRAASRRARAALLVLPLVALVTLAAFLATQMSSTTHEPAVRKWVPVGYGVEAALEVKNLTFRRRWGTTIEADGYDRLQFRLTIRNANGSPAPPLIARLYVSKAGEVGGGPRVISVSFGLGQSGPFTVGPRVDVTAQSNGLYQFHGAPFRYGEPFLTTRFGEPSFDTPKVEELAIALPRSPPAEEGTGEEYAIPSIPAPGRVLIGFSGSYYIPGGIQLSGGSVMEVKNPRGPDKDYATTTSAIPGDTLTASAELFNTGFRGADVRARIAIDAEQHGTVSRVTLYAKQYEGPFQRLGSGSVNSGSGVPIKLSVQPGSTEVVGFKTKCRKEKRESLPDGIAERGIDVGPVGGWLPRDPCHSDEFNRFVLFKLDVR
jgi:transcriptional regulator with XRE-family HTH domain